MANICPVCGKKVGWNDDYFSVEGLEGDIEGHDYCKDEFDLNPEKYGGTSTEQRRKENSEITKIQKEAVEQKRKEQEDKSVYVKGFSMPFGEMVEFMVKWAIASIPAFIILFIIFGIFFAMFGAMFVSTR